VEPRCFLNDGAMHSEFTSQSCGAKVLFGASPPDAHLENLNDGAMHSEFTSSKSNFEASPQNTTLEKPFLKPHSSSE